MAEPSPHRLHAALATSFAKGVPTARRHTLLQVLDDDLRTPGGQRRTPPIPRVVLGLALANLVAQQAPATRDDPVAHRLLDRLVADVFGWNLAELGLLRGRRVDPLQMLARQYGILDYRWDPPTTVADGRAARIEVLVQHPVDQLRDALLDPAHWSSGCALFWQRIAPVAGRPPARPGTRRFTATLKLPTAARATALPVVITAESAAVPLGFGAHIEIARATNGRMAPLCRGVIRAERERGQPWATRITHEKSMRPFADHGDAMLAYWIQAETVCLALAAGRAAARRTPA